MRKWYFPSGRNIEKASVNDARIETFKDDAIESLAREVCQNSLDAHSIECQEPVLVTFSCKTVSINKIPDIDSYLNKIIDKARLTWKEDKVALDFLDEYEKILKKDEIIILKASDYNTTGLLDKNWDSLIKIAGSSYKNDVSSAGSFGIGKAAPFANSDLRMVFYSTKRDTVDSIRSIGVSRFVSFDKANGETTQGVGYYGKYENEPMEYQISLGYDERDEIGTDVFVIAFSQPENWKDRMKNAILENFMISIYNGNLIVEIDGLRISKENLGSLMNALDEKKYRELINYYSVLVDPNVFKIKLDDRFKKYGFKKDDGIIYISQKQNANRSILMTRKAGMKIYDRKGISGSIQFNGIFQILGDEFNEILKEMENPNHDKWVAERYKKDPKLAERLLRDMFQFMKENVIDFFEEKIEDRVDAFGLKEFLPNKLNETNESENEGRESLNSQINEVTLLDRKIDNLRSQDISGDEIERDLIIRGIIDGDEGGLGTPKDTDTETKGGKGHAGVGDGPGDNKEDSEGRKVIINSRAKFKESKKYKARIIEVNYKEGRYKLYLSGRNDAKQIKIKINLISETGYNYKDEIRQASLNGKSLEIRNDTIVIEKINSGNNLIHFQIPYDQRIRMGVKIYEN